MIHTNNLHAIAWGFTLHHYNYFDKDRRCKKSDLCVNYHGTEVST